ncbi:hypothetical protein I3843_13G104500 [Carya illinoinensis]|nr:hypothetical protein I3843_13G104500 [Carya illinoinensis]
MEVIRASVQIYYDIATRRSTDTFLIRTSAYLQLVNLADTKLYDSTQFFRFGSSIYDLSFMDVDKILPFSSTLGWHSLQVKLRARFKRGKAYGIIRLELMTSTMSR